MCRSEDSFDHDAIDATEVALEVDYERAVAMAMDLLSFEFPSKGKL